MTMMNIVKSFESKGEVILEAFDAELAKVRTARAHPGLLESVQLSAYGQMTPLKQVASISSQDARTLVVTPWDKSMLNAIAKAILEADLGLNPAVHTDKILVPMPLLTEERRKELSKLVRSEGERCKVNLRHHRRDVLAQVKQMVKQKELTEDDEKRSETEVDKIMDRFSKQVDLKVTTKEKEVMAV